MSGATCSIYSTLVESQEISLEDDILIWQKSTSACGHDNFYLFAIDTKLLTQTPVFKLLIVKHINKDSAKNIHRYTYVKRGELVRLAREGYIFKAVIDYASSRKRKKSVSYYTFNEDNKIVILRSEQLRDSNGFYDIVYLPDGRKIKVTKNTVVICNGSCV